MINYLPGSNYVPMQYQLIIASFTLKGMTANKYRLIDILYIFTCRLKPGNYPHEKMFSSLSRAPPFRFI